jgi:hypothetical protein
MVIFYNYNVGDNSDLMTNTNKVVSKSDEWYLPTMCAIEIFYQSETSSAGTPRIAKLKIPATPDILVLLRFLGEASVKKHLDLKEDDTSKIPISPSVTESNPSVGQRLNDWFKTIVNKFFFAANLGSHPFFQPDIAQI